MSHFQSTNANDFYPSPHLSFARSPVSPSDVSRTLCKPPEPSRSAVPRCVVGNSAEALNRVGDGLWKATLLFAHSSATSASSTWSMLLFGLGLEKCYPDNWSSSCSSAADYSGAHGPLCTCPYSELSCLLTDNTRVYCWENIKDITSTAWPELPAFTSHQTT